MKPLKYSLIATTALIMTSSLTGCSKFKPDADTTYPVEQEDQRRARNGSLIANGSGLSVGNGGGFSLFGGDKKSANAGTGVGVNSFLWRATLDTLSFMPLASVDPHGGVVITDWYEDPASRGERFKVNALILGKELRSDGVRVSVFRQAKSSGIWQDATVAKSTATELEDQILTRARELLIQSN